MAKAPTKKADTAPVQAATPSTEIERIVALEAKVQMLWDMVVFLGEHPHYRVGDYIKERGL